jgi:hypothetical protein
MVRARILFDSSSNPSDAEDYLVGEKPREEKTTGSSWVFEREESEVKTSRFEREERSTSWIT